MSLSVCSSCSRHARVSGQGACPFCGATIVEAARAKTPRVSRTAKIIGVAAIGVACGGTGNPADGGSNDATEDFSPQPAYGAVIPDSGVKDVSNDATSNDASNDAGESPDVSGGALYGAPPPPGG